MKSWGANLKKVIAAIALGAMLTAAGSYSQSSNELMTSANMATAIADGNFINSGNCSFSGTEVVSYSTFTSCIQNNGSCNAGANSSTYQMTFGDMTACAVLTTTITATTDPWLTDGSTYWGSSASYSPVNPTISGEASGAQMENGTSEQALNGGGTILSGTTIVATAYGYASTSSVSYNGFNSGCTTTISGTLTATGSAEVAIANSSGTIVASTGTDTNSAWNSISTSYTIPAGDSGEYYIQLIAHNQSSATVTTYSETVVGGQEVCGSGTNHTAVALGYATDGNVAN